MTNEMANIRARVMAVYDYKPGWVARVNMMPDRQVMAIFRRFAESCFDPDSIKKDGMYSVTTLKREQKAYREQLVDWQLRYQRSGVYMDNELVGIEPTLYLCDECKGWFTADNPELTECRHCGDSNIIKGRFIPDMSEITLGEK